MMVINVMLKNRSDSYSFLSLKNGKIYFFISDNERVIMQTG